MSITSNTTIDISNTVIDISNTVIDMREIIDTIGAINDMIDAGSEFEIFRTETDDKLALDHSAIPLTLSESKDWMKDYLSDTKEAFDKKFVQNHQTSDSIKNYTLWKTLGSGSFGKVVLATYNLDESRPVYAIKMLNKEKVVKTKQVTHTMNEKRVLYSVNCPFIIKLIRAFKDTTNLYMVMEFACGGEIFSLIRRKGRLPEEWAQFYSYQVIIALQYLHCCGILYRDIKPENILIDQIGYCKLADLGFAKRTHFTWTLCGTPQYIAPEMILNKGYGKSVDYWGFGILIYEMIAGYVPFDHKTPIKLYEMIVECNLSFPSSFKAYAVDLLTKIIEPNKGILTLSNGQSQFSAINSYAGMTTGRVMPDVTKRYGNLKNGAMDIVNHQWYSKVEYRRIYTKSYRAPWIPSESSISDGSNFEKQREETIKISKFDRYEAEFSDF